MGKLISACDVARSVDVSYIRAKLGINRNAFLGIIHARLFEIETGDRWLPAGSNQHEISPDLIFLSSHDDLVTFLARRFLPAPDASDSFALENSLHHLADFRLVLWE